MNPEFLKSILQTFLVPKNFLLFIALPAAVILISRWGYRRSCRRNERAIDRLSDKFRRDLLSTFPNYTGTCYSIGFWTVVLSAITSVASANYILWQKMTPEMMEKIAIVRSSGNVADIPTSLAEFNVMTLFYAGPGMIALLFAVSWLSAWFGMACEWYLRRKFEGAMSVEKPQTYVAVIHEPYWPMFYRRYGKKTRYWPFYVRFSGTRDKRSVLLTREAIGESQRGYFLNTMPKLPGCPKKLFWTLMVISFFTPLQFVFFPYAFLLAGRCFFIPDASLERQKAS